MIIQLYRLRHASRQMKKKKNSTNISRMKRQRQFQLNLLLFILNFVSSIYKFSIYIFIRVTWSLPCYNIKFHCWFIDWI